jgi:hypothetical protein
MPHDAIIGARYMDTVFNSEFAIVGVRTDTDSEVPDTDEIIVTLEYEDRPDDRLVEIGLDEFQTLDGIYVTHVPEHAQ